MANNFHLDIITPTSIDSFNDVEYLRIPSIDGLIGIKAHHANAIIGIDIGEVKIILNGEKISYATSGGFADIANEGVQLLLETIEKEKDIDKKRATQAFDRAQNRIKDKKGDLERAQKSLLRAKNRLHLIKKLK